jgi:hypothetical protein
LASGGRLRIPVDTATLRIVLRVLRAQKGMIHLPASVRVYLSTSPCGMRRSFDGLYALVTGAMPLDAFGGVY